MIRLLIAMLLIGVLLASGCGQPAAPVSSTAAPAVATTAAGAAPVTATTDVDMQNFAFAPKTLTAPVGTTVRWTNKDSAAHTATSGKGAFESGNLAQGQSFSFKFTQAGTFDYVCKIHPNMAATIRVQ